MSVSKLLAASGANDFNVTVSGTHTAVTFTKEYSAGAYTIASSLSDTTYDIYAINANGTVVGYTNSPSLTATGGFSKLVILGQTTNNLLSFTYKTTYTSENATAEVGAGPVVASVSPSDVPNSGSTTVVTGRNFATDVQFYFSSGSYTSTISPSVTRTSATSATVTRPSTLPIGTYTITAVNPGITSPTGSNSHILENCITAGNAPVWSTSATLPAYTKNTAYSQTVTATDSSDTGSTITYSTISNSLPSGLSITGSGNVISGTPTVLTSGSVTLRATDSGGNYVERTFTIANVGASAPVWTTTTLQNASNGVAYSQTLTVTDDSGATPTVTLQSGTLPTGITLAGLVLSGTCTADATYSFTLRATDANGSTTDQAFSIICFTPGVWSTPYSTTTIAEKTDIYGGYYNGFMYFGGGQGAAGGSTNTDNWAKVSVSTGVTTQLAGGGTNATRDEMSSIWLNGKHYVVGGYYKNSSPVFNDIAIYDDSTNTWSVTGTATPASFGTSRAGTDGTNIYFMAQSQSPMFRYNVSSNTFTTLATSPSSSWSQGPRLGYYSNKFYAITDDGSTGRWVTHIYNVSTNTWTTGSTVIPRTYGDTYQAFTGGSNYAYGVDVDSTGTYMYIYGYDQLNVITGTYPRSTGGTSDKIIRYNIATNNYTLTSYADAGQGGGATGTDGNGAYYVLGGASYDTGGSRVFTTRLRKVLL
jgi:hypothetical protein